MLWNFPEHGTFTAKISDFGISKKLDPERSSKTTEHNKGTAGFVAKEIVNSEKKKLVCSCLLNYTF